MTGPTEENGKVSYSVKDLFTDIKGEIAAFRRDITAQVESLQKQISGELTKLNDEVDKLKTRVTVLETNQNNKKEFNALWIPLVISIAGNLLLAWITWLSRTHS